MAFPRGPVQGRVARLVDSRGRRPCLQEQADGLQDPLDGRGESRSKPIFPKL